MRALAATRDRDTRLQCQKVLGSCCLRLGRLEDARRHYQVLLIHDPEAPHFLNLTALRARYALTGAECSVLEALVKVGSPKAIAAHMGNSENTVRCHLKSILGKTGTHRQSELIQLALAVPDF